MPLQPLAERFEDPSLPMHRRARVTLPALAAAAVLALGALGAPQALAGTASSTKAASAAAAGTYVSLPTSRILDTTTGVGAPSGAVASHGVVTLTVLGRGGVPTTGVGAVWLDLSVSGATGAGDVIGYPDGTARPALANLTVTSGVPAQNMLVLPVPANGKVDLYNGTSGTVQLAGDVRGYSLAGAGTVAGSYTPVTPQRVMDTTTGVGGTSSPVPALKHAVLSLKGLPALPKNAVGSVLLDVRASGATAAGQVAITLAHVAGPAAAVDFAPGRTSVSLTMAQLGTGSKVWVLNTSKGPVDVAIDLVGYTRSGPLTPSGEYSAPGAYAPLNEDVWHNLPSQGAAAAIPARTAVTFQVAHPANGYLPASGVGTALLAVTAETPSADGSLVAYPGDGARPTTPDVVFTAGRSVTSLVPVDVDRQGNVTVYNNSPGTVLLTVTTTGYFVQPRSLTLSWTPTVIDLPRGDLRAISCVDAVTCVAVDWFGNAIAERNGVWGHAVRVGQSIERTGLLSVSCPTATFCAAVGTTFVATFDGVRWAAPTRIEVAPYALFTSVSCASATFCVAVDALGQTTTWDGTTWHPLVVADPLGLTSVSCPAAGLCFATDGNGGVARLSGGSWQVTAKVLDATNALQIACPSSTSCEAISADRSATYSGGSWKASTPHGIVTSQQNLRLACASATYCAITDLNTGGWWTSTDGHTWASRPASGLTQSWGLACVSSTSCVVLGSLPGAAWPDRAATFNGTSWSVPTVIDPYDSGSISGVQCPTTTFCLATDGDYYMTMTGTTWSPYPIPMPAGVGTIGLLTCATPTDCVAATGNGVTTYNGSTWSAPRKVSAKPLTALSCPTTTFCLAVDSASGTFVFNGTSWSAGPVSANPLGRLLSCVSATFCMNVLNNQAMIFTGSHWGAPTVVDPDDAFAAAVSCTSATECVVLGGDGQATRYTGTWQPTAWYVDTTSSGEDISCVAGSVCEAVNGEGQVGSLVDGWGGVLTQLDLWYQLPHRISCASAGFCVMTDEAGIAFTGRA